MPPLKVRTDHVVFTFPSICPTCQQEEHDNESEEIYRDSQTTLFSLLEAGPPICQICDAALYPENLCEVIELEDEDDVPWCEQCQNTEVDLTTGDTCECALF